MDSKKTKPLSIHEDLPILGLSLEQSFLFSKIENTNNSYFIQGQAGTGKSTFIKYLYKNSSKKIRILSPTAIAALNIGGVTIHSFFQLPIRDFLSTDQLELKKKTDRILKKTDVIVIDEISMVRPDLIDCIDFLLKQSKNSSLPFGGTQMIFVGDLCQLPPVIKNDISLIFKNKYGFRNSYFFDSKAFKDAQFFFYEFQKVYRQHDQELLTHLTHIRLKQDLSFAIQAFNKRLISSDSDLKGSITITPYRAKADNINTEKLQSLQGEEKFYHAKVEGSFLKNTEFPAPKVLALKVGATVIFTKNNPPHWINGSGGEVVSLTEHQIKVKIFKTGKIVTVLPEIWNAFSYEYDKETDSVTEKETGSFLQYPLQLGYALTIHKAQGKTLDKVIIDTSAGTFAHGQLYVALSRTKNMEDIFLTHSIEEFDVILDSRIPLFLKQFKPI